MMFHADTVGITDLSPDVDPTVATNNMSISISSDHDRIRT